VQHTLHPYILVNSSSSRMHECMGPCRTSALNPAAPTSQVVGYAAWGSAQGGAHVTRVCGGCTGMACGGRGLMQLPAMTEWLCMECMHDASQ